MKSQAYIADLQRCTLRSSSDMEKASNADGSTLWKDAFESLEERYRAAYGDTNSEDLAELQQVVTKRQDEAKQHTLSIPWKGKSVPVREIFDKVSVWVERFIKVTEGAVKYDVSGHAALARMGVKMVLQTPVNSAKKHRVILGGTERVSELLVWTKTHERLYSKQSGQATKDLRSQLTELYRRCLVFLAEAIMFHRRGKLEKLGGAFGDIFDLSSEEWTERVTGIETQRNKSQECSLLLDRELNWDTSQQVLSMDKELMDALDEISRPIARIEEVVKANQIVLQQFRDSDIANQISPIPYLQAHQSVQKNVMKDTGMWLLQNNAFMDWARTGASELFWLRGMAGSGKSSLLSILVQQELEQERRHVGLAPLFFYCKKSPAEPELSRAPAVFRSLLRQFCTSTAESSSLSMVRDRYQQILQAGSLQLDETVDLLTQVLNDRYEVTHIYIDALDECDSDSQRSIIECLETILENAIIPVKVFSTSRNDPALGYWLQEHPNVEVKDTENSADVRHFVNTKVNEKVEGTAHPRKQKGTLLPGAPISEDLKREIKDRLTNEAGGMFRWADAQLQYLSDTKKRWTVPKIRERLGSLPESLSGIYEQIYESGLSEIDEVDRPIVKNMFHLLLALKKRISAKALTSLLGASVDKTVELEEALGFTFNLLELDTTTMVLTFAHLSVGEFLQSRYPEDFSAERNEAIATTACLKILIESGDFDEEAVDYAEAFWGNHARASGHARKQPDVAELLSDFLAPGSASFAQFSNNTSRKWLERYFGHHNFPELRQRGSYIWSPSGALFAICIYDLAEHLQTWKDADAEGFKLQLYPPSPGSSAFFLACDYGSANVLKLIVSWGLWTINADAQRGHLPLMAAASSGNADTVDFLLKQDASIHRIDELRDIVLHGATHRGHASVVELLLKRRVTDVNSRSDMSATPLWIAIGAKREDLVILLLNHGADVNMPVGKDTGGWSIHRPIDYMPTPLEMALRAGKLAVVKTILARKDLNDFPRGDFAYSSSDLTVDSRFLLHAVCKTDDRNNPQRDSSLPLGDCTAVSDGKLCWRDANVKGKALTQAARDPKVSQDGILTVEVESDGSWKTQRLNLTERIANITGSGGGLFFVTRTAKA